MSRKKSNKFIGVFNIFFSGIKTYFLYLDQCAKYLAFPIFGQVISIIIIFSIAYFYTTNIDNIRNFNPFFENDKNLIIAYYVVLAPFIIVLVKAFFDYLIAFASLNILFFTVSGKNRVKNIDFKANDNVIKRKLPNYIFLTLIISIICILFSIPPLIIISPFIWLFLCLTFQVFALEGDISAPKSISRSIEMVKSNIIPTVILLILCVLATYMFLPNLILWTFEKISVSSFCIDKFELFFSILPVDIINSYLSIINTTINPIDLAITTYQLLITIIIIGFTLPFRCCCFTELYKLYDSEKIKENSNQTDEIIKRATGRKRKN